MTMPQRSPTANEGHLKTSQRECGSGTLIRRKEVAFVGINNVLSETKKQQVIALGRLGWPLRRIEQETGARRETAGTYLKAAGVGVRPPRGVGTAAAGKTGQRGDHRVRRGKTGQCG